MEEIQRDLNSVFSKYLNPRQLNEKFCNKEECAKCGGQCCKRMGCHFRPQDFKEFSVESMINFINESQCISIDWWEGNPLDETDESIDRTYFLRIQNEGAQIIDGAWIGKCKILESNGCPLIDEYRPWGGYSLTPNIDGECPTEYTKQQCAIDWMKYQDVLRHVVEHYGGTHVTLLDTMMGLLDMYKTLAEE